MQSLEIVKKAINFDNPPRLPKRFPECGIIDFNDIKALDDRGRNLLGKKKFVTDEWGSVWYTKLKGNQGRVVNTVIDNWGKLASFKTPDAEDSTRYSSFNKLLKRHKDRYVLVFNHFCLFERMHFLVGFNRLMEGFYLNYNKVSKLADMIVDFQLGIIKNLSKKYRGYIHGMWTTDDWGTQSGLLISKKLWIDIFKPRYKIISEELNRASIDWWFHSCGKISDIIDQLVDIGVKVVNTYQPTCLGIEDVGRNFNGRICFETSIDMQKTIFRGENAIKNEAYDIVKNWSTKAGGLVVTNYHHEIENSYIRKREFKKVNRLMCKYFDEAFSNL